MAFEMPPVVIDNGSYNIKAGFACDNHPVSMFRTVVGRPNYLNGHYGREYYDVLVGDEAVKKIKDVELNQPVVKGRIVHWDNMERVWHHIFYKELKAAPEDRSVMLACSVTTPMSEKLKCCEIFFETLNVPGLCIQSQGVLALYGSGCTTGLSVDLGSDTVDICPVYEGGLVHYAHMHTNYAGQEVSNYFQNSLCERQYDFGVHTSEVIEGMKKNMYITQDIAMCRKNYRKTYTVPSGEEVDVSQEAFMAAEMLFNPALVLGHESEVMSLQDAIVTAASKCDEELKTGLYDAIVPSGGMAMIPGINNRLAAELQELLHRPVNILTSNEAYAVSWLGGATFAGMPASRNMWVTKKQFEDYGAKIVRNKFM